MKTAYSANLVLGAGLSLFKLFLNREQTKLFSVNVFARLSFIELLSIMLKSLCCECIVKSAEQTSRAGI